MSWDIEVSCPLCGHTREWNYTSNTSEMLTAARADGERWHTGIDGGDGATVAAILSRIIHALVEDSTRFIAMNPPNGWGNYHDVLAVLLQMHTVAVRLPTSIWKYS